MLVDAASIVDRLRELPARDQITIEPRYGLDGGETCTLGQVGRILSITRQSAHALLRRALRKLRDRQLYKAAHTSA